MMNTRFQSIFRAAFATFTAAALAPQALCASSTSDRATGNVTLTYAGKSRTSVLFLLDNDTNKPISLHAKRNWWWSDATPYEASVVCIWQHSIGQVLGHLRDDDALPSSIEIGVGKHVRLSVQWNYGEFALKNKDSRCHLELQVLAGPVIQSNEFTL